MKIKGAADRVESAGNGAVFPHVTLPTGKNPETGNPESALH